MSLSGNEARFLQELRWEQIQGARRPEQALDISLGKADGEGRRALVAKGVKVAVDTASKRIDDYLEGLREDDVKLTYPSRLKWAMEARLKEICQKAKAVLNVVAYFRKLSETKETLKTDVHLLGVDQDSMESVKGKIDDLGAPVSLEMKIPQKMTGKLRAKALDIAKEHNVGIDFSNSAVTVFAITADDLEMAKESMVALFEDKASVSDSFLCGDSLIMKLMSSKMKGDVVCMAKDQGVFVHPDKSGSNIILRGSKKHIEGLKQKLEVFVAQIAATLVEDRITLDGLHAAAVYVPSVVAKVNSLQNDHNVVVTWPRKSRTTVVVNELKVQSVGGNSRVLQVCFGSIVDEAVDAIVNAANESLVHAGGVARALCNAGGHQVQVESNDYVSSHGKLHTGQAVTLSGGDLKCRYLIHVVSPRCTPGRCTDVEREQMKMAVTNSLIQCDKVEAQSVAFPALVTGIFQFPVGECAEIMVSEITQNLMSKSTSSINVARIMLVDESIAREFDRVVRCRIESSSFNRPLLVVVEACQRPSLSISGNSAMIPAHFRPTTVQLTMIWRDCTLLIGEGSSVWR